jgi:hypothetical protein
MQYATVDKLRAAPAPKLKGTCPACSDPMIAKCGSKVIWHWAHAGPPATRKDVTPLNCKTGGLMEQSNASLQRGDEG